MLANKKRLLFIDKASGIAILLVVYGHIYFPETMDIDWYQYSHKFIYKFHMPLFMLLSGYLAFLSVSRSGIKTKNDYLDFQKKKLYKFLPVYLLPSICAIALDYYYKHLPVTEINEAVFHLFFSPAMGSAVFVWYIYVLMGFYLVTPFLLNLQENSQYLVLMFAFLLTNATFSPIFSADLFCKYLFFFFAGGMIYNKREAFMSFLHAYGNLITFITICLLLLDLFIGLILPFQLLSIGVIASVLHISNLDWPELISKLFITLGVSSFAIYILNGPVLDLYYILFKNYSGMPINGIFIFSSLSTRVNRLVVRVAKEPASFVKDGETE